MLKDSLTRKVMQTFHPIGQSKLFAYLPSIDIAPKGQKQSRKIIQGMQKMNMHPGSYAWGKMVVWPEAVLSTLKSVDNKAVMESYPKMPANIPAVFQPAITWESTLFKIALSFAFMIKGVPVPYGHTVCTPTIFSNAFIYLSLNALRNAASDLMAKYGFKPESWAENRGQIKWDKLTTSLIVTSLAYPFLATAKAYLHSQFGASPLEFIATPLALMTLDGAWQLATRKLRGYDTKLAYWDFGRPFSGDIFATLSSLVFPQVMSDSFLYLLTRKFAAETWSGIAEGIDKRKEKTAERQQAFSEILNLKNYKVPYPEAMAAINLAHIIARKSVSPLVYHNLIRHVDSSTGNTIDIINGAMSEDRKIRATIDFLFPPDSPLYAPYNKKMWSRFKDHREAYHLFLEKDLV